LCRSNWQDLKGESGLLSRGVSPPQGIPPQFRSPPRKFAQFFVKGNPLQKFGPLMKPLKTGNKGNLRGTQHWLRERKKKK